MDTVIELQMSTSMGGEVVSRLCNKMLKKASGGTLGLPAGTRQNLVSKSKGGQGTPGATPGELRRGTHRRQEPAYRAEYSPPYSQELGAIGWAGVFVFVLDTGSNVDIISQAVACQVTATPTRNDPAL